MELTLLKGYPDRVGRRFIFSGNATGPTSYSTTTGDVVTGLPYNNVVDVIFPSMTVSRTYEVRFYPSALGARVTWAARWYTISTGAEVANGTDLSAEQIQVGGFGGTY